MRILVTGHKGFIGGHIYDYLEKHGYEVYGYDVGDDLGDSKYDVIIHLAARGLIRLSIEYPYEYFNDNLALTLRFLEIARRNKAIFVFSTSGSVENPTNPYSLAKKHSEEWIRLYDKLYGMKSYILRFYNIYGENSRKGAVYLFTRAALKDEVATVYGNGSHIRDYVYVGDVVKVIKDIIDGRLNPGEYEAGTGMGTSVNDLIELIEEITGKKIKISYKDYILEEAEKLVAKNPIIKNPTPLKEGIKHVMTWILNNDC
ncbi:NAD-dependent dehydratase [Sulfodiicoccus acidiphilus]|uniref:NAD-dependent dehydratase n=1 Tax=Sulfodiicoccus acidiphilus TaxID=1670455 RepID=A0A348B6H0_9CREN|nr:NAD-dependent epimerase/dehydratase family protein [Sulfodiicoccus acidiphilus]BBD73772.1 NAD-dependent dehydratase [Sulfodiicoccus acidiphilus]GGT98237.1 NAD-dependent dehydratase [Sulfodiicoccus acidiphilus]